MKYSKQFMMRDKMLDILEDVLNDGKYIHHILSKAALTPIEHRSVVGVIEKKIVLDEILDSFLKKKPEKRLYCHLLLSVYMTIFLNRSSNTTIDISTEYARKRFSRPTSKLTYALLKNSEKIFTKIMDNIDSSDKLRKLYIEFSLPYELGRMFLNNYSMEEIRKFLESEKVTWYRVVQKKREEVEIILSEKNIDHTWSKEVTEAFSSDHGTSEILALFSKDEIIIQDLASQILVDKIIQSCNFSQSKPKTLFDGCCAPGGKAIGLIPYFDSITLNELAIVRFKKLKKRMNRVFPENKINFTCIDLAVDTPDEKYDVILLDVPCSGLWTLNRKPDIRLNFDKKKISILQETQKKILTNALNFADNNSIIIYSTCTFNQGENEDIVEEFINLHRNVKLIGKGLINPEGSSGIFYSMMQLSG